MAALVGGGGQLHEPAKMSLHPLASNTSNPSIVPTMLRAILILLLPSAMIFFLRLGVSWGKSPAARRDSN
jgi:hypothetical protein